MLHCLVQTGSHLDFSQALADAVKTAAERAEEVDDSLKTFMFVIPRVSRFAQVKFVFLPTAADLPAALHLHSEKANAQIRDSNGDRCDVCLLGTMLSYNSRLDLWS